LPAPAADTSTVTAWTSDAPEPFAGNAEFWRSVTASVDALVTLLLAIVVVVLAGPWGAIAFAAPACLLARAAVTGRRSEQVTRPQFPDRGAWRLAERQAVGAVMGKALVRKRWPFSR
jgi:hypothetical protein